MTTRQPAAAPGEAKSALQRQIEDVQAAVDGSVRTTQARRDAEAAAAPAPTVGVVKNAAGQIVVTSPAGRTVVIDPSAVNNNDGAVRKLVEQAFAPPRPPTDRSGQDVAIVAIIFPCLIVLMLIVWRIVATAKRPGAAAGAVAAGVPPELAGRLARIEQAIEAVAIEVERIAESERYSARLLTDRLGALAPAQRPDAGAAAAPAANGAASPTVDPVR